MNYLQFFSLRARRGAISRLESEAKKLNKQLEIIEAQIRELKSPGKIGVSTQPKASRQLKGYTKSLLIEWFKDNKNHPTRVQAIARELKLPHSSVYTVLKNSPNTFQLHLDTKCFSLKEKTVVVNNMMEPEV